MTETRQAYQTSLRAIGAYLDQRPAGSVRVIEVPEGFDVHWLGGAADHHLQSVHLPIDQLLSWGEELKRKKTRRSFRPHARITEDDSYENVFRALGSELDALDAYSILVDELEDGFLVTYQFLNPHESYMLRKHMMIRRRNEMFQVLSAADARRQAHKHSLRELLAG